jgi:superfamily II DNA helicase RecQ
MPSRKIKPTTKTPERRRAKKQPDFLRVAREYFGYESLRPGQEQAIRALLNKRLW